MSENRAAARPVLHTFRRHPVWSALALFALDYVIVILAALLIRAALPGLQGQSAALAALLVTALEVVVLLTFLGWRRQVGMNGPRSWRNLGLLILPAVFLLLPFVGGFRLSDAGVLVFLVTGYS